MKPEQLAKASSEFAEQSALFCWCALNVKTYPELKWYHAIKNEERSGNVIAGARAKQSGIKKGVSDTFLPVKRGDYSGLYIELKKKGGKPSSEQLAFGAFVKLQGYAFVVCEGWEKATNVLVWYLTHDPV